ncbi:MAG: HEAT repeat domain-containing protein, partial [Planctomycetota bacterium]
MRKPLLLLLPLALVGAVLAQDSASPEDLVRQLGDDDYAVREGATKKLVEMGEKAVPALEKALQSEDLEVRLRAGRALRAIRDDKTGRAPEVDEAAPAGGPGTSRTSGIELNIQPGKVILRRTEFKDG